MFEKNNVVFIRSGVGNGKTSLARFMAKTLPGFHFVLIPSEDDSRTRATVVKKSILDLAGQLCQFTGDVLEHALMALGSGGHTLIFDEAHLLFATDLCGALFKSGFCNVLLFSASSQVSHGSVEHMTSAEISARYIWTPPAPAPEEIDGIVRDLNAIDGLNVDRAVFDVIYMLSGGEQERVFIRNAVGQ